PRDVPAMSEALIEHFSESGGRNVMPRKARVLIIFPDATDHQRWVFHRLSIFGILPLVRAGGEGKDQYNDANDSTFDMLENIEDMPSKSVASMAESFRMRNKPILVMHTAGNVTHGIELAGARMIQADSIAYAMRHIVEALIPTPNSKKKMRRPRYAD